MGPAAHRVHKIKEEERDFNHLAWRLKLIILVAAPYKSLVNSKSGRMVQQGFKVFGLRLKV